MSSSCSRNGSGTRNCDHSDIVLLSELLRCFHNCGGRLCGHGPSAFKAEELALLVLGFNHTVRIESQPAARLYAELCSLVAGAGRYTQRQRARQFNFFSV